MTGDLSLTETVVIFDLEYTTWEGALGRNWTGPNEFREVVQIGAVKLNAATLEEVAQFETFTRPTRNPILSDYFVQLTKITNERLARDGVSFEQGYADFLAFCGPVLSWSYGRDASIITENLSLHGLERRMPPNEGQDITAWLKSVGLDLTGINSGKLAAFVGAKWQGREHDGVDDARSIAAAVRVLIERGITNPFINAPETKPVK